jgi:hypothetical protein
VLAYFLVFIAFVFWKLDRRNVTLIKNAEDVLAKIEATYQDTNAFVAARLFTTDKKNSTASTRFPRVPLLTANFSFSNLFNMVFLVISLSGFFVGSAAAYELLLQKFKDQNVKSEIQSQIGS